MVNEGSLTLTILRRRWGLKRSVKMRKETYMAYVA